jgi:hypothetical protein
MAQLRLYLRRRPRGHQAGERITTQVQEQKSHRDDAKEHRHRVQQSIEEEACHDAPDCETYTGQEKRPEAYPGREISDSAKRTAVDAAVHDRTLALSHPDFTVGSGISPDHARASSCARSRALPPVRT